MHLSIVTDEITQDFVRAVEVCADLNIDTIELRQINGNNIVYHDMDSLRQIRSLIQQRGLRVCAIASPFLKVPLWLDEAGKVKHDEEAEQWRILQRSFELAEWFGAPLVRTFSFMRVPDPTCVRDFVLDVIGQAVKRTEMAGLKLVIENEHACNIATGAEADWLLQRIPSSSFGITWDPGNEAAVGSHPFPEGYQHVRGRVLHMHVKDVDEQQRWAIIGQGTIDYVGQFRALAADGYDGMLSIETHYVHPEGGKERATYESYPGLIKALREARVTWTAG